MFTVAKRSEIRSSVSWIVQHLIRADVVPNSAISDHHDQLSLKYLHEAADHYGYILVKKSSYGGRLRG